MPGSKRDDLLGSILRRIPGFRGYGQREDQKASEQQTREFVNQQLQQAKVALDRLGRQFADQGKIDQLAPIESLRDRLESVRSRIDRPVFGPSGLFGKAVDEEMLEDLYDLELTVMDHAEQLLDLSQQLDKAEGVEQVLDKLQQRADELSQLAEQRHRSLQDLGD